MPKFKIGQCITLNKETLRTRGGKPHTPGIITGIKPDTYVIKWYNSPYESTAESMNNIENCFELDLCRLFREDLQNLLK